MQDETAAAGKSPGRIVKAHNLSPVKAPLNAIFGNMINKRKTVGVFLCAITSEQKKELCRSISRAAKDLDYNVIFFSFIGTIGADYRNYAQNEHKMLDIIPFDELDGICLLYTSPSPRD